jgi:hypothetical protein
MPIAFAILRIIFVSPITQNNRFSPRSALAPLQAAGLAAADPCRRANAKVQT